MSCAQPAPRHGHVRARRKSSLRSTPSSSGHIRGVTACGKPTFTWSGPLDCAISFRKKGRTWSPRNWDSGGWRRREQDSRPRSAAAPGAHLLPLQTGSGSRHGVVRGDAARLSNFCSQTGRLGPWWQMNGLFPCSKRRRHCLCRR